MNKKLSLILTLLLVLTVWGIIGYKIVSAFSSNDNKIASRNVVSIKKQPFAKLEKPNFTINIPKRDPFLGKTYGLAVKKKKERKKVAPKKKIVPWPHIVYKGNVSDKNSTTSIYLVEVDGVSYFLKQGDVFKEHIKLVKAYNDKVVLSLNKETKVVEIKDNSFSY